MGQRGEMILIILRALVDGGLGLLLREFRIGVRLRGSRRSALRVLQGLLEPEPRLRGNL